MTDAGTGWERDRRTHFDEIVRNYDSIRPNYTPEMFADAIRYSGRGDGKQAIEIGAGTGKATYPFLDAGYAVTAVELGANMSEALRVRFADSPRFNVINAPFEEVELPDGCCDLIYAASAFHWLDAATACPKTFRLLRSGGAIALFRYNVLSADNQELNRAVQGLYDKHYHTYYTKKGLRPDKTREMYRQPQQILDGYGFGDLADYGYTDIAMDLYDAKLSYSGDDYVKLMDTMSDHRKLPESNRLALFADLRQIIEDHGGLYTFHYVYQSYKGRKP